MSTFTRMMTNFSLLETNRVYNIYISSVKTLIEYIELLNILC